MRTAITISIIFPTSFCMCRLGKISITLRFSSRVFLPRDGMTTCLDFGGEKRITGRLLNNGAPVRRCAVELAAGDAMNARYFGPVQVNATTDDQGHFTFYSPPLGHYTLYGDPTTERPNPLPLKEIDITGTTTDLGDIEMDLGTVRFTLAADDSVDRVPVHDLAIYENRHPERFWQDDVASLSQVPDKPQEWVANNVPATPLVLHVPLSNYVKLLFPFQRDAKNIESRMVCKLPAAFATVSVPQADDTAQPRENLRLVSTDGRISAHFWLDPKEPQTFRIPAATYLVMDSSMEATDSRAGADRITFAAGESRTFHLADFPLRAAANGVVELRAFSHEGVLLTSSSPELFTEKQQPLAPTHSSYLGPRFNVPTGTYHAVLAQSQAPAGVPDDQRLLERSSSSDHHQSVSAVMPAAIPTILSRSIRLHESFLATGPARLLRISW